MRFHFSRQEIIIYSFFIFIFLLVCLMPLFCKPRKKETKSPERLPCSGEQATQYLKIVQEYARQEEMRRTMNDSLASRQAAWLFAKADYALHLSRHIGGKNQKQEERALFVLEDTCRLLIRACPQSRLGLPEIQEEKGSRLRAYLSEIDHSFQTYSVSVPPVYDPGVKWPLLVSMHGHGWYAPFQGHPAPSHRGIFCVSPQGRGATDYKDLGELDVLQAIEEVKKDFNIDEDRIYLTGGSMGGTGSFHLGAHYADRFAGIFPIVGNADNLAWTDRWGWNREFTGRFNDLRYFLQEGHTARAFARNLFNLPSYVVAGAADTVVPPEHSRNIVAELRKYSCPVEYREYPNIGHGGFPADATNAGLSWTCAWQRNKAPEKIYWKAALLKHGRAYWLKMEQMKKPLQFAEIEAKLIAENQVEINTNNLLAFAIDQGAELFNQQKPLFVNINGERLIIPPNESFSENWQAVRYDSMRGWDLEKYLPKPDLYKRKNFEGPMQEALMTPFIVVVGTQSADPAMNEAWAREARTFVHEWKRRNNVSCLIVKDTDCTMEMLEERNLILFGSPLENSISSQFADVFPLHSMFAPLRAQGVDLEAPDVAYHLIYPAGNAQSDRLLLMLAANSVEGVWQQWGRFGNFFNWGVYDSKKYYDYAVFDSKSSSPETMLLNGWFGTDWSVENGIYFLGDETLRRKAGKQHFPLFAKVEETEQFEEIFLIDLLPEKIDQMRGAFGSGRSFYGEATGDYDIGVRAPANIEYKIQQQFSELQTTVTLHNPYETELCRIRLRGEKVRFTIWGDKQKLAEATVDWNKPEAELKADLKGVRNLKLETAPAGGPSWLHAGALWKNVVLKK